MPVAATAGATTADAARVYAEQMARRSRRVATYLQDKTGLTAAGASVLEDEDFARTIFAMGTSLLGWTRELSNRNLFASDARVIGLTSEGSSRVWPAYAAVSTAKAALEALSRAIAVEFAPRGVRSNVIWAGVADTPALRKIPGGPELAQRKARENPLGRLTTPDDVGDAVCLLCSDEARWINGSVVRVDGGEHLVA